jgi:hypothetical protein
MFKKCMLALAIALVGYMGGLATTAAKAQPPSSASLSSTAAGSKALNPASTACCPK